MTGTSELRHLSKFICFPTIGQALNLLSSKQQLLNSRRRATTTLALEHAVFVVEANHCNQLLKEIH